MKSAVKVYRYFSLVKLIDTSIVFKILDFFQKSEVKILLLVS